MKPHFWLEFPKRKVVLFSAVVAAVLVVWLFLPTEVVDEISFRRTRKILTGWLGGWFTLLFVRVEDLNIQAPANIQSMVRWIAICAIIFSVLFGGFTLISIADHIR